MAIQGNAVTAMDPYSQRLASIPEIPRKIVQGDGTEPGGTAGVAGTAAVADPTTQGQPPATLQHASDADKFRVVDQLCRSQDRLRRNRFAIDSYHTWLDSNIQFGRLDKVPNQSAWVAKLPPGVTVERGATVPNKAADLCNKVTDTLLADPPKPNPTSTSDDQESDAAADLASTILREIAGESGVNEVQQYRWALRNALTRSTSFLEYDVDPKGGGYQPYQIMADPNATSPTAPLVATDPVTGAQVPSVAPILRYVSAAGQFVDQAAQAERVWLPSLVVRKHHRGKVLLFPATAPIEDATHGVLTDYCTLGEGRKRWPDTVGTMGTGELATLANWRPSFADLIVPFAFRGAVAEGMTGPDVDQVGSLSPMLTRRMFFYRLWVTASEEYPDGYWLDVSKDTVLGEGTLGYQVTLPTGGQVTRCRDIPLVQVTPIQDVADLDPMGWPFEARFDGSAQADATLLAHYLDALERMANPHVFLPSTTSIDEDEWFDRSRPHLIGPTDKPPFYEEFSPLPPVVAISEYLQTRQDTASGLTATAQGLDSENAQSGIAKQATVRQAQISLTGILQQLHGAFTRGWRLSAQLIQSTFTTPQLLHASGENVSGEEQWWTGEDFGGLDDIGIEPGTGTMMTAEDKANYVRFLQDSGWKTQEEGAAIATAGIARDLGLPSDPVKAAIDRSIDAWKLGPPNPEWVTAWQQYEQALAVYTQAMQQYQLAQQIFVQGQQMQAIAAGGPPNPKLGPEGQNAAAMDAFQTAQVFLRMHPESATPPVPPNVTPPPKPWTPFVDRPNDTEPAVAAKWMQRLSQLQMTARYESFPPEWRQCADERYTTARQAVAMAAGAQPSAPVPSHARPRARVGNPTAPAQAVA